MTDQINARIAKHEASKASLDQNNPKESTLYQYHVDMIKSLKAELPKQKITLHVMQEAECESCSA